LTGPEGPIETAIDAGLGVAVVDRRPRRHRGVRNKKKPIATLTRLRLVLRLWCGAKGSVP